MAARNISKICAWLCNTFEVVLLCDVRHCQCVMTQSVAACVAEGCCCLCVRFAALPPVLFVPLRFTASVGWNYLAHAFMVASHILAVPTDGCWGS